MSPRRDISQRHIVLLLGWKPARVAMREMRKHIGWYFHGLRGAAQLRGRINTLPTAQEVRDALAEFAAEFSEQAGFEASSHVTSEEDD